MNKTLVVIAIISTIIGVLAMMSGIQSFIKKSNFLYLINLIINELSIQLR